MPKLVAVDDRVMGRRVVVPASIAPDPRGRVGPIVVADTSGPGLTAERARRPLVKLVLVPVAVLLPEQPDAHPDVWLREALLGGHIGRLVLAPARRGQGH